MPNINLSTCINFNQEINKIEKPFEVVVVVVVTMIIIIINALFQEVELCIGCMIAQSSVKLVKCCGDSTSTSQSCMNCYCRPMWCLDCMAKW